MSSYTRKYYLIRKIKAAGFDLLKSYNERMILVPLAKLREAEKNKAITELMKEYQYGVQMVSSLEEPKKLIKPAELIEACNKVIEEKKSIWKMFVHKLHRYTQIKK